MDGRVSILSIGVWNYDHLPRLRNVPADLARMRRLFVEDEATALFQTARYKELRNPTAATVRDVLADYTISRSAVNDVLILYFSGHGYALGDYGLGLCTKETRALPGTGVPVHLTLLRLEDVLQSISQANAMPVIILDTCYSGAAADSLNLPAEYAVGKTQQELQRFSGSKYALLCSCAHDQMSLDTSDGGFFSRIISRVATEGLHSASRHDKFITLRDIFPALEQITERDSDAEMTPRLYLGDTLLEFPFSRNIRFKPQSYKFSKHYAHLVAALFNGGQPYEVPINRIGQLAGNSAYGNHQKLSYKPWNLLADGSTTKVRKLTPRGIKFAKGRLSIPVTIELNPVTGEWIPSAGTEMAFIDRYHKTNTQR